MRNGGGEDELNDPVGTIWMTMEEDLHAIPDRSGDTPIIRLYDQLKESDEDERESYLQALTQLVKERLAADKDDAERASFWGMVYFLSQAFRELEGVTKNEFVSALKDGLCEELKRGSPHSEACVNALNAFVASGGRPDEEMLRKLKEVVYFDYPVPWLHALVISQRFDLVEDEVGRFLSGRNSLSDSDIMAFSLALPNWGRMWAKKENARPFFYRVLERWKLSAGKNNELAKTIKGLLKKSKPVEMHFNIIKPSITADASFRVRRSGPPSHHDNAQEAANVK